MSFPATGIILLFTLAIQAQKNSFLPLTKLETKDGLSSPNVRKILQDKYGFMWFGTQDGLNRFDGANFIRYISAATESKHAILESDVYDLALEENGDYLWCLTAYGGLSKIDVGTGCVIGTFTVATHPLSKNKLWFKSMSLKDNFIYIVTDEGFLMRFNITKQKVDKFLDLKKTLDKVYEDDYGRTWLMLHNDGIRILDSTLQNLAGNITRHDLFQNRKIELQYTGLSRLNDDLLICTNAGLLTINIKNICLNPQRFAMLGVPRNIAISNLFSISTTGIDILISGEKGLYSINKNTRQTEKIIFSKNYEDKNWLTLTNCIFQTEDNVWIGSPFGVGWIKNTSSIFTGFFNSTNNNGVRIDHSTTLVNCHDSILACCSDNGLYFANYVSGVINKFPVSDFYFHAFKIYDKYLIVSGVNTGLHVTSIDGKSKNLRLVFPELAPIRKDLIISSAFLDDSLCFMASQTQKGIYIWNYKNKKVRILNTETKPFGLSSNTINRLYIDSKKRIWIIGDNTVSIYDHHTGHIDYLNLRNTKTNEPLSINMDICEAGGRYWMLTYGTGIVEISPTNHVNRIYSFSDGINNLGLYKIFKINDSTLIASSNNGLYALNIRTGKIINYFEEDGLQSNSFEETSGCETDKFLFLGGINGFTKIDKSKFYIRKDFSKLYFSSIQIHRSKKTEDTLNLSLNKIEIPNDYSQVTINFSCLNYTTPEKILSEYRLIEKNEKWNQIGSQKFVPLTNILPGDYHLQIRSTNEIGNWSAPIELLLIFQPKWYQTLWFKLLLALTFIAAVYGLYRIRINHLKKQQAIRIKLASDLHDDLGSTLNSIKVYSNLALMEPDKDKYLVKIKEGVQGAVNSVKDMIWVLDDSKDTVEHLFGRVRQFAASLCEANGIHYKEDISNEARDHKFARGEKRNLYMILKEAANNACKYSQAKEVTITFSLKKKKPVILVKDNGIGFDTSLTSEGNGLKNMKFRAKEIKYQLNIDSDDKNGTFIRLQKI